MKFFSKKQLPCGVTHNNRALCGFLKTVKYHIIYTTRKVATKWQNITKKKNKKNTPPFSPSFFTSNKQKTKHSACEVDATGAPSGGLIYWAFLNDVTCGANGGAAIPITYDACGTQEYDQNVFYELLTCPYPKNFEAGSSSLHVGGVLVLSVLGGLFSFL